jgi:hypothetical protein
MPYLCVANPATLRLCLQCFSLAARYIAILSLLPCCFTSHSKSIASHFSVMPLLATLFRGGAYLRVSLPARVSPW